MFIYLFICTDSFKIGLASSERFGFF